VSDGQGGFVIDELEVGDPAPGEVMVRIRASGLRHTDAKTLRRDDSIILGHEGAGIVERVGREIPGLHEGDRVILNWAIPCGGCYFCDRGAENLCERRPAVPPERFRYRGRGIIPSFRLGTLSEYTVVAEEAVVRIPDDFAIPFASACILGCGVMTGVGSVLNVARVGEGASVVVLGTGGVGLSVIQGSVIAGAEIIIGVDVVAERLEMARRFGATHTLAATREDEGLRSVAAQVKELTADRGAEYAFECLGVPELGPSPLRMIRNGGTAVGISGIEKSVPFDMELFEWDKTYINPLYGQCRPSVDFPKLLNYYREGGLKLDEMVTRTYSLDQLGQAFEDMRSGRNAKGVIVME
jgi:Zn-dependent alcohol dehydrogenase